MLAGVEWKWKVIYVALKLCQWNVAEIHALLNGKIIAFDDAMVGSWDVKQKMKSQHDFLVFHFFPLYCYLISLRNCGYNEEIFTLYGSVENWNLWSGFCVDIASI